MAVRQSSKLETLLLLLLLSLYFIVLNFSVFHVTALNIGIHGNAGLSLSVECSRTCESKFCKVPPFLRYGKYCGLLYGGCPGERPCDGLDLCCMKHDACIQAKNNDYLSQECSQNFLNCINRYKKSGGGRTFKGNTCQVDDVIEIMTTVMDAALLAGGVFHKP